MTLSEAARKDIGKKEKPGNLGFFDAQLENDMLSVGWHPGYAWCSSIQEKWVWEAYPDLKDKIKGLFVPSAVNTFRNLIRAGYSALKKPEVNALVYWQKYEDGKALWQGHAGIVSEVINDTTFKSIEGNASYTGSRNGDGVYELTRMIKKEVRDGLKVIGFIML
jgi:hypothetical protein